MDSTVARRGKAARPLAGVGQPRRPSTGAQEPRRDTIIIIIIIIILHGAERRRTRRRYRRSDNSDLTVHPNPLVLQHQATALTGRGVWDAGPEAQPEHGVHRPLACGAAHNRVSVDHRRGPG